MGQGHYVSGAIYRERATGLDHRLLGLKMGAVVLRREDDRSVLEVAHGEFFDRFEDTGIHDHGSFCCTVHGTHAEGIHRGCILR